MSLARIARRARLARLAGLASRRIFFLPERLVGRPGPGLAQGLKELYEMFLRRPRGGHSPGGAAARLDPDAAVWPDD